MSHFWWNLPGPSGFLQQVTNDLLEGRSVVVRVPEHVPDDLPQALRRAAESDWRAFEAEEMGADPAAWLLNYFDSDAPPEHPRNCRALVESPRFRGRWIMASIRCSERARVWQGFLADYEARVRAVDPFERSRLCVILRGDAAEASPLPEVALSVRTWRDAVGETDMMLWAAYLLRDHGGNPTAARMFVSVLTRLCLWDPLLAVRLADERLERILDPSDILGEIARERGWDGDLRENAAHHWCRGVACEIDGQLRVHSAALAGIGQAEEVAHRVWAGQVGVIFPFVEERRRALLQALTGRLIVPYRHKPDAPEVSDVRDLELSHIHKQIRQAPAGLPEWLAPAIWTLVDMRNRVAHFDVVPASRWDDPALAILLRTPLYSGAV